MKDVTMFPSGKCGIGAPGPGTPVVLGLLLLVSSGCGTRAVEDVAARRARESNELSRRLTGVKIGLYRVLKTAMRSLPRRTALRPLLGEARLDSTEGWMKLIDVLARQDPALARLRNRPGLFALGLALREALIVAAVGGVLVTTLAALVGTVPTAFPEAVRFLDPRLLPGLEPLPMPAAVSMPTSAAALYHECKDILADDEDRYRSLSATVLDLDRLADTDLGRRVPLLRLASADVEHLVFSLAWYLVRKGDLALYEVQQARREGMSPLEQALLELLQARLYADADLPLLAMDKVESLESRIQDVSRLLAGMGATDTGMRHLPELLHGLLGLLKSEILTQIGRIEDAQKELLAAEERLRPVGAARGLVHLFMARRMFESHDFKNAVSEVRKAADAATGDPDLQARLRELAVRIESELPGSLGPVDLARYGCRLLLRKLFGDAAGSDVLAWGELVRNRLHAQMEAWKSGVPGVEDLNHQAAGLWERVKTRVRASLGNTPTTTPAP
jgi:hypothetical protein